MGVDLGGLVPCEPISLKDLAGKIVVIDGNNVLYQFLSSIRQPDGTPLMDAKGRVTSHLAGLFQRTANLVEAGVLPAFVWDGAPDERKMATILERRRRREEAAHAADEARAAGDLERARSKAAQSARLTKEMIGEADRLLRHLGIPTIQAPGEGEAQAAAAVSEGRAYASVSQDFDSLLFGAPRLVRNLTSSGRRKLPGRSQWVDVEPEMIVLESALKVLELTRERLVAVGVLMGTDFHPGIKGIGPKKALAAIRKHGSLERAATALGADASLLADVAALFLDHRTRPTPKLSWGPVDRGAVLAYLVDDFGFSSDRITTTLPKYANLDRPTRQGTLTDFL